MRALTPHFFHAALLAALSLLPLWSGGFGPTPDGAFGTTVLILFGICIAVALNEYLVKASDINWEYIEGRWKFVLPIIVVLVGANIMNDNPAAKRAAMSVGFGLIGLTAMRAQSQTDVLLRVGLFAGLGAAFWGLAGLAFFWCVPVLLMLALALAYDPPETRAYLGWRDHGHLALIILALSAGLLMAYILIGMLLHLGGFILNPAEAPVRGIERAAATESRYQIKWWDFVILAALAYFCFPYIMRLFGEKNDEPDAEFQRGDSPFHRIAEQFKKTLGRQSPRERVIYSYHEMLKALIKLGFTHDLASTPLDTLREIREQREIPTPLCDSVSALFYRACYNDGSITEADAAAMQSATQAVIEAYRQE
ncbi:DUF4129 domain-containing protein [Cerasicoccus maritimus]|uniref:DUF4129 domain-containing protein n=1 Tax=Cerasicoccus maritimus TaxID=490089 RepID=UPI002852B1BD|nr:DUF4129 domain-containing protein [Cerasicoccus maritimus]